MLFHTTLFFSSAALGRLRSPLLPDGVLQPSVVGLIAGAVAATVACVVGVPLEVVKHRMQVTLRGPGYETPWRALRSAVRDGGGGGGGGDGGGGGSGGGSSGDGAWRGVKGLYTGLPTTLLRNVPYNAVQVRDDICIKFYTTTPFI